MVEKDQNHCKMSEKVLYDFDRFQPCERMRKHAFACRNTQQTLVVDIFFQSNSNRFLVILIRSSKLASFIIKFLNIQDIHYKSQKCEV